MYSLVVSAFTLGYGQSIQELQKLKTEYEKFQKDQSKLQIPTTSIEEIDPTTGLPRRTEIVPYQKDEERQIDIDEGIKHFGYDFFTRRDTLAFWENLPTPSNYLLGPGDELIISLWGETQLRETLTISREGKIYDEKVGLLTPTGRTMANARDYLKSQYGRVYATLNGNTPSTFIDVSLGELRSINVNFVGQVKYPGVYPIHPFSTVITGLIQAGGVDTTGSLRQIQIKREGTVLNIIDLYDFFIKGELSSTIQLRDQDIVVIPPRSSMVTIDSAVIRPGIYESIPKETIYDMIQHAGGPTYDATEKVGIRRIKPRSEVTNGIVYEGLYADFESTKLIPVSAGDHISVRYLFTELQQVEIIGQVKVPGLYHFFEAMEFKDLLDLSGGFEDSTFIKSVYLKKAEIIRRNPGSRYDKVIPVDLRTILNDSGDQKLLLQNLDRVVIHANLNFFEKENVLVSGEVNVPGAYPLTSDNESLKSVLNRAGGLTTQALENGIAIYRDKKYFETNLSNKEAVLSYTASNAANTVSNDDNNDNDNDKVRVAWQNSNIALMPGDSVVVKEKTATIFVTGAVYNSGVLEFRKGKSLRFYLNAAGGLTNRANDKGIIVLYANGIVSPKKWYSNPTILEGSTIIVNQKAPEEPFDITQFATNWTSIVSSLITVFVLSQQL